MKLNHIDLPVTDLEGAADYFQRGFGFERLPAPVDSMAILRGKDGFALILQQVEKAEYPKAFHIGFLQGSDDAVHAAYQRLADAGLPLPAAPATRYGCLAFWCQAPRRHPDRSQPPPRIKIPGTFHQLSCPSSKHPPS